MCLLKLEESLRAVGKGRRSQGRRAGDGVCMPGKSVSQWVRYRERRRDRGTDGTEKQLKETVRLEIQTGRQAGGRTVRSQNCTRAQKHRDPRWGQTEKEREPEERGPPGDSGFSSLTFLLDPQCKTLPKNKVRRAVREDCLEAPAGHQRRKGKCEQTWGGEEAN